MVESIAQRIDDIAFSYDITQPSNRDRALRFTNDDLVIIGLPVYVGRIPLVVDNFLKQLNGNDTPIVLIAVYGNRHYDDALLEMKDIVSAQGFTPIAAGAFIGEHSYTSKVATNRPDAKDLEICVDFGHRIKTILIDNKYQGLSLSVNALNLDEKLHVDEAKCTKCHACVRVCPEKAIIFDDRINPIITRLESNFSARREPEMFIQH